MPAPAIKIYPSIVEIRSAGSIRLMALSYYLDYQPEKAKLFVKKVLQMNPDYHLNFRDDDLSEFRTEVNNQEVVPSLTFNIYGGYGMNSISPHW